jgi:tetratricopeptide (TPR) repeat protein
MAVSDAPRAPRTPNNVLRGIRENERHESRNEFADAMMRLAWEMGVEVYPDGNYVHRLESGEIAWPHRTYRNILEKLCGRSARDLGFAPSAHSRDGSAEDSRVNVALREAIWESGMELTEFARKIGIDPKTAERWITLGRVPQPFRRWRASLILGIDETELWPDVTPRQEMSTRRLKATNSRKSASESGPAEQNMLIPGQSDTLRFGLSLDDEERIIQAARRPMRVDSSVAAPLAKILAAHRETEDIIGSVPLMKPVTSQLSMLEDLVKESRGPGRPEIIDISAQWAEYSGWLYTSTGNWQEARAWFDRTSEWAAESCNPTLAATSLSFKGHVAFLLGQIGPMIGLTQAALRDSSSWVGQRAYDAHQLARGLAIAGDSEEAVRKVEEGRSLALIAHERSEEKPPWIYYYTLPFYALERGFVYRFLGRDNNAHNYEAIASLSAALDDIGEARSSEWAAEYIYHLAVAYMQAGSPDKACETALEVLRIASTTESKRLMDRLNRIYARLAKRWPSDPCIKELGEALR